MCGIFGVFANYSVTPSIIEGLTKLEYRGYDSSGISILDEKKQIKTIRSKGKLNNLKEKLKKTKFDGNIGIGHTRWATHGVPSTINAHPHVSESVSIVHNGIIENYSFLKQILSKKGYKFKSQTDSEVIAHLLDDQLKNHSPEVAIKMTLSKLEGAFALAILFKDLGILAGARKGSPLALGISEDAIFLGSDSVALAPFTEKIIFLEEGDSVFIDGMNYQVYSESFKKVKRKLSISSYTKDNLDKGNFNHYMQKEIYEQPHIIGDSLSRFLDPVNKIIQMPDIKIDWRKISKINLIACGTSFYSCQVATYWIEKIVGVSSTAHLASEFRYKPIVEKSDNVLSIFISQSGETADTLAALKYAKNNKSKTLSLVNASESSIARESHFVISIAAGPEIGVASTKAFSAQLSVLACLCLIMARKKKRISKKKELLLTESLLEIPSNMLSVLDIHKKINKVTKKIVNSRSALFLGRGLMFPIAMEGALKLKEISYIHAEGYASGEMKHGPIALVDDKVPVIIIAPKDFLFEKNISNMQEIMARGGDVILITDENGEKEINDNSIKKIVLPNVNEFVQPILYSIPVQLIAYIVAVSKGTDVDQPRNLAKSVTVE